MPFLHLLVVLFVISCSAVQSLEVPYNYVVGSVVTSCGHPTFHSIPSTPYPAENGYNVSMWTRDPNVRCFQTVGELLTYCQKIYDSTPHGKVNQVVLDPFRHSTPKRPLYSSLIATTNMRRYMCMHSSSPSVVSPDMPLDSLEPPSTVKPAVHSSPMPFPTLIEVHKALFSERLLRLSNETKSNVSQLIHHMITESEGLRHLHNLNSASAQHLPSSMLQQAHEQLERIWEKEEAEWFELESERHNDLVKQLESADWASENEFVYVMQEFNTDPNRVQDALAILLDRLAASVQEEVRHLDLIRSEQPWALQLEHESANWTAAATSGAVSLEKVHQALMKHVRTATIAINALHSVMAKAARTSSLASYKPSLLASYNKLQQHLLEAQRVLNEAKSVFLQHLKQRMHSNLESINANLGDLNDPDHAYLRDWIQSKHHEELVLIDTLVSQLFASDWHPKGQPNHTSDSGSDTVRKKFVINLVLYSLLALAVILLVSVVLMAVCYHCMFRSAEFEDPSAASARKMRAKLRQLLLLRSNKLKHWWQFTGQPVSTLDWKVGHPIVVVDDSKIYPSQQDYSRAVHSAMGPNDCASSFDQKATDAGLLRGYGNPTSLLA